VTTPSLSVLKERLHNRATDSDEIIAKRVINALGELEHLPVYDAIVINEDFNESIDMLESLIKASRWKQKIDDLPQFISGWRSGTLV
jgi:guanylate kinase